MPTPLGHALAGLTVLWCARALPGRTPAPGASHAIDPSGFPDPDGRWRSRGTAAVCVCLAVAPDLDLLLAQHRSVTHSVTSAVAVGLVAALLMRILGRPTLRAGLMFGLIWASHPVLDWMGHDSSPPYGIMALWPFSERWFISNLDLFSDVSRRYWLPHSFWLGNLASVAREVAVLGPAAAAAWWAAQRTARRPGG